MQSVAPSSAPSNPSGGVLDRVVATLGKYIPMQNARMVQMLLAKHGGIYIMPDDFEKLPLYFRLGCIPIMTGMPLELRRSARVTRSSIL